jgi:hypothetical protein
MEYSYINEPAVVHGLSLLLLLSFPLQPLFYAIWHFFLLRLPRPHFLLKSPKEMFLG